MKRFYLMINIPVDIEKFLKLAEQFPVVDVRSPAEFAQGHIPGAHNIPLFDNEERTKVGTAYKQTGRQAAIKRGLELTGKKLVWFITEVEKIISEQFHGELSAILLHCWRGGMRSANFAYLLNLYGIKTFTLIKGYKAYRNFVLQSFEREIPNLYILGGETGSGKTEILSELNRQGENIIDLEKLAEHKGSAFGALGKKPQPTQEQFENNLSSEWCKQISALPNGKRLWMEDESRSIGKIQIPNPLWEQMKRAPIIRVQIPKEERIRKLVNDYGKFSQEKLMECILKIEKRLGPQHTKHALEELQKENLQEVARITLTYYDKAYYYHHEKRNFQDVFFVECETADAALSAKRVIEFVNKQFRKEYA